jgi:hypothetical protein
MNWAHIHLIVNEIPVLGALFAAALLSVALFAPARDAWTRSGLLVLGLAVLGLAAAFLTGIPAVEVINGAPRTSGKALSQHHVRGLVATTFGALSVIIAVASFLRARKNGSYSRASVLMLLVTALGTAASLIWTGQAGGRINHPELQEPGDLQDGPAHPH